MKINLQASLFWPVKEFIQYPTFDNQWDYTRQFESAAETNEWNSEVRYGSH